jgi:hypothetical protein
MKITTLSAACVVVLGAALCPDRSAAADPAPSATLTENFEGGYDRWQPTAAENWKLTDDRGGKVLDLFDKTARTQPPHRSPFNFVLLKDARFTDLSLTAKVRTTTRAYGHRDIVVVFGYQDTAHFYYAHFGEKADDHACQVFIVNDAPRTKISTKETTGIPWKEDVWHTIRVTRTAADGMIRVYFDDLDTPVMEARDTTLGAGQVGFGSFDDTARFDDVVIEGTSVSKK